MVGGMVVMVGGARLNFGEELGDDGVVERGAGVGGRDDVCKSCHALSRDCRDISVQVKDSEHRRVQDVSSQGI